VSRDQRVGDPPDLALGYEKRPQAQAEFMPQGDGEDEGEEGEKGEVVAYLQQIQNPYFFDGFYKTRYFNSYQQK
jgi:hypothetical protein